MKLKCGYGVAGIVVVIILTSSIIFSCSKKEPPVEDVYKTKILKGTWAWDIDADADEPGESMDIWWEHVNEHERYLVPTYGSGLAVIKDKKFEDIDLSYLEQIELGGDRISASDENPVIDVGTILAVRTTQGNLAKMEVTGFEPPDGNRKKYNMKLRYVLYETQDSNNASTFQNDSLKIVSVTPQNPAILLLGEKLIVKVQYNISSVERARIWVRPYTQGRRTSGYAAHASRGHNAGRGVMEGWFRFDGPAIVDEVRVKMVPYDTQEPIAETTLKINAEWTEHDK